MNRGLRGKERQCRKISTDDASFLTEIFSVPEYDLYFAENDTTQEEWKERIATYYLSLASCIVSAGEAKVG